MNIAKGQEVCTSYLGSPHIMMDWKSRQEQLAGWIDGKCGCERCVLQEARDLRGGRAGRA